jgi:Mg-chelatase subunit ChlD
MEITNPTALLLLLILPIFVVVGFPRSVYRRIRGLLSLLVRLVLVILLVLALAGLQLPRSADRLAVVFLVDVSDSMSPRAQDAALDYVRTAVEELNADQDQAAVVLFGANAVVEQPMTTSLDLSQLGAAPITLNTDLAEAIRLGLALFPPETSRRMVILTDGVETVGDAESAAQLAAATGVQIDYVPFASEVLPGEVLVTDVSIPPRVNQEEQFDLVVNVQSEAESNAELRVLAAGAIIYRETVALRAGDNRYVVGPLSLPETGFVDFRVQVEPLGSDGFYQNNELSSFTEVKGRPSVLLVASDDQEIEFLRPALEENGLVVDVTSPRALPTSLAALSAYGTIMLVDTPATELTQDRMELLQIYVRDLGGGLVAIGGPHAYGVGGYYQTPLEEILPVEMRIRDQERIPSLTMLFVLDRSGSMEVASGPRGFTNLELAKEAILRSFGFLNDYDRTGVISFDTQAYFVVDLQEVGDENNRKALETEVSALRPGGGTDIYGALVGASQVLPNDPSALKHMILLTDGGANPAGSLQLAEQMFTNDGITLSVVAVGQGYAPWLRNLAVAGRGNFHEAMDVSTIPSIFTAETVLATRSYIIEEEFLPTLTGRSPIMEGIRSAPSLQGYVATTEKDTATVILRATQGDPLLASWQYGLGRAVAFTSDASARWGVNWVMWEDYARFWSQAARWTITEGTDSNLEIRVEQRGEQAYLVVDARDNEGEFLNGLNLNAAVVSPDLQSNTLNVPQVAPGRYEIAFTPETQGAYFVRVAGIGGGEENISVAQTGGWVLSYSAEYTLAETDVRFLENLSDITGGQSLEGNPKAVFDHNLSIQNVSEPIWQYLLAAAALLLVLDIAVRRIVITQSDLQAAGEAVARAFQFGSSLERRTATSGRMTELMDAKRRTTSIYTATEYTATEGDDQAQPMPVPRPAKPATPSSPPKREPSPGKPQRQVGSEGGTLASRLLEKRKHEDK